MKKLQYNSPVVLSFAIAALVSLILGLITENESTLLLFAVYRSPLTAPLTYVRLFLHTLGHSSYSHFMNNMLMILVIGPALEEKYGCRAMLCAIVVTSVVTGLFHIIFFDTALLGASGVVFMMIVLSSYSGIRKGCIPLTLILVVLLYLGDEIVDLFSASDNVSHYAHLLGGLCGVAIGMYLNRPTGRNRKRASKR